MTHPLAIDHHPYPYQQTEQDYVMQWFPPSEVPDGQSHGSAAICLALDGSAVLGSQGDGKWELPGGRPERGEDWRATLGREVMEEVCARITEARLVGFARAECLTGEQAGRVLVRSMWVAHVTLDPWNPQHEIVERRTFPLVDVLDAVAFPEGQRPVYRRWLAEAMNKIEPLR